MVANSICSFVSSQIPSFRNGQWGDRRSSHPSMHMSGKVQMMTGGGFTLLVKMIDERNIICIRMAVLNVSCLAATLPHSLTWEVKNAHSN